MFFIALWSNIIDFYKNHYLCLTIKKLYFMDGIGDYIYIIILVLAGLSGLFKSKKKKTTETEMPFPEQSEFEEFESYSENYSEDEFRYENLESEVSRDRKSTRLNSSHT